MAKVDNLTLLPITFGFGAFTTFLPELRDIRKANFAGDPEFVADVRMGEMAAVVILVGAGGMISFLSGDYQPLLVAALMAAGLIALYETALRGRPFSPGGN